MNNKKKIQPTTLTIFLLPITLVVALTIIDSLPGVPEGDTTYSWLPIMLVMPVFIAIFVLIATRKLKSEKLRLFFCVAAPTTIYVLAFISPDGIPRAPLSISVWFGALLVSLSPTLISWFKAKSITE